MPTKKGKKLQKKLLLNSNQQGIWCGVLLDEKAGLRSGGGGKMPSWEPGNWGYWIEFEVGNKVEIEFLHGFLGGFQAKTFDMHLI